MKSEKGATLSGLLVVSGIICILPLASVTGAVWAGGHKQVGVDASQLPDLSLEELMNIEVTSVSKKAERFFETTSAVYVITQEDIRRFGVTSIPEALRMAPGLEVARIDGNRWVVTSRGFSNAYANKLLVLMDGRSIYTPLFGGVYWDVQDTFLEDIDRIEVIRGPGATMWGANAVNGVINIITKSAVDTQGTLLTQGIENGVAGGLRYGGTLGENGHYRTYFRRFNRDNLTSSLGGSANDGWDQTRGGFRGDWDVSDSDSLTLQGDIYGGNSRHTAVFPTLTAPFSEVTEENVRVGGGNMLARWKRVTSDTSDMSLQVYYDRTSRIHTLYEAERRNTYNLNFQRRFRAGRRHDIMQGFEYFVTSGSFINTSIPTFDGPSTSRVYSAFIQDDITMSEDGLHLTLGSKFEHSTYTGLEVQPSVRLLWTPNSRHTGWAAISHAVSTPAAVFRYLQLNTGNTVAPDGTPVKTVATGNPDLQSEHVVAYELGYRVRPTERVSLDIAVFYNRYRDLWKYNPGTPSLEFSPLPVHLVVPMLISNGMFGQAHGIELTVNWNPAKNWRLAAGYTWLQANMSKTAPSDVIAIGAPGASPRHQFHLLSYLDLPHKLQFNAALYYVDHLPALDVPGYVRLDLMLMRHAADNRDLSIGVTNLLDSRHKEFGRAVFVPPSEIERSLYGKMTWRF